MKFSSVFVALIDVAVSAQDSEGAASSLLQLNQASTNHRPKAGARFESYEELLNDGSAGPCRLTSPTDNDISAWKGNKIWGGNTNCVMCESLCSRNLDIQGNPRRCKGFECSGDVGEEVGVNGALCELWDAKPGFAGATAVNQSAGEDVASSGTASATGLRCYAKNKRAKKPKRQPVLRALDSAFYEITTDSQSGPCRGVSPDDNDLSAFGANKIEGDTDCDTCAQMCANNIDAKGNSYPCESFECTPAAGGPTGVNGPVCELWWRPAQFAGRAVVNRVAGELAGESGSATASTHHCFSKQKPVLSTLNGVFYEVTTDGQSGPCRLSSPFDAGGRDAYGMNKMVGGNMDCDACATLCASNIDFLGNSYDCKAFECNPPRGKAPGMNGAICELWNQTPNYVGATIVNSASKEVTKISDAGEYHCFSKTVPTFRDQWRRVGGN